MALGKILQDARLRKKMTTSQVAAATRMKIQTVEAIEREDFSRITAPVYGKGFIRLCAECLEVDPRPLIDEYMEKYAPRKKPSLVSEGDAPTRITEEPIFGPDEVQVEPEQKKAPAATQPDSDLFSHTRANAGVPPKSGVETKQPQGDLWDKPVESAAERMWEPESTISSPISGGANPFQNKTTISVFKHLSIAVGVIVILVFLVSGISRWTKKAEPQKSPVPQTQEKLRIAVDPPAPYVD
jgi:transcriptional regulator with XRE-family HTH domain